MRDLEHAGIARAVVPDAHPPAVIVPVQKDEAVGLYRAVDVDDRQLLAKPTLLELGADRDRKSVV